MMHFSRSLMDVQNRSTWSANRFGVETSTVAGRFSSQRAHRRRAHLQR
jgi:hypothetical protein